MKPKTIIGQIAGMSDRSETLKYLPSAVLLSSHYKSAVILTTYPQRSSHHILRVTVRHAMHHALHLNLNDMVIGTNLIGTKLIDTQLM